MKKILYFVLAIICVLAFTGFGGGANKTGAPAQAPAEKVLRVGTDANYPPFEYYQGASGTFIGFDVELMDGVARKMGYNRAEFVDVKFNNLLTSLRDGQVDAVISCMTITDERKKTADFTEPYLVSSNVVVGPSGKEVRSAEAIKGKRIAVERDSIYVKQAEKYSAYIIKCDDAEEALRQILDKKADFAIMDNHAARFYNTHFYKGELTVMAELPDDTGTAIGIAVAKGNKELLDKLNAGLRKYREDAAYYQMKNNFFGKLQ
jgi:polar amino acid transport system substrate-binding protein